MVCFQSCEMYRYVNVHSYQTMNKVSGIGMKFI